MADQERWKQVIKRAEQNLTSAPTQQGIKEKKKVLPWFHCSQMSPLLSPYVLWPVVKMRDHSILEMGSRNRPAVITKKYTIYDAVSVQTITKVPDYHDWWHCQGKITHNLLGSHPNRDQIVIADVKRFILGTKYDERKRKLYEVGGPSILCHFITLQAVLIFFHRYRWYLARAVSWIVCKNNTCHVSNIKDMPMFEFHHRDNHRIPRIWFRREDKALFILLDPHVN